MMTILEAESKAAPLDRELKDLREAAVKDWLAWHGRLHHLQAAAAEKADKGQVLATVFVPHLSLNPDCAELKEVTITPRRVVRRYLRRAYYMRGLGQPSVDIRCKYRSLASELRSVRESAERWDCPPDKAREHRARQMPAWARAAA